MLYVRVERGGGGGGGGTQQSHTRMAIVIMWGCGYS